MKPDVFKFISQAPNEGSVVIEVNHNRATWQSSARAGQPFTCLITGYEYYANAWCYRHEGQIISREGMVWLMRRHPNALPATAGVLKAERKR